MAPLETPLAAREACRAYGGGTLGTMADQRPESSSGPDRTGSSSPSCTARSGITRNGASSPRPRPLVPSPSSAGSAPRERQGRKDYSESVRAAEIVGAVEAALRREHRQRPTIYRREWSIGVGATRIDVAAINGSITGCEIKSVRDNFGRLASQVPLYSAVLDEAVLVVEGQTAVERATHVVPDWWGIWHASHTSSGPVLDVVRPSRPNPAPDPLSVAQLLWRDEAYGVLDRHGFSAGLRKATRWRLWQELAVHLALTDLQHEVRETIKARPGW
jgi:hypothetical protein